MDRGIVRGRVRTSYGVAHHGRHSLMFCAQKLEKFKIVLLHHGILMLTLCVLILTFSVVAIFGNLLVIRALWKASSVPAALKKLFLSLAVSDLTMGLFAQPMFGVILAVMINKATSGDYSLDLFCPTIFIVGNLSLFLLSCASFLNVTAIAVDRLLAIFLHLRYQELVTPKRITTALVSLWLISGVAASIYIFLPNNSDRVSDVLLFCGLLATTVAYIRIYKTVRHHQNQIQIQCQFQHDQAMEVLRQKKSAINALFVYVVFLACYVPYLCSTILLIVDGRRISFLAAYQVSLFLVILNSSVNPVIYCWRYREIREIAKNTVKEILRTTWNK
ncbi:melanocyte-stimulating hormone receptor-like [Oculina patagonica]